MKRYDPEYTGGDCPSVYMQEFTQGDYVTYDDAIAFARRVAQIAWLYCAQDEQTQMAGVLLPEHEDVIIERALKARTPAAPATRPAPAAPGARG